MYSYNNLTVKQAKILEFIRELQRSGKNAPTYREIAGRFGFRSPKAAVDHVFALEKKGFIRRHSGRSRGIELVEANEASGNSSILVPIVGNITAGLPWDQQEQFLGTLTIDPTILGGYSNSHLFALSVSGDSMEGRGIYGGDWVIVEGDAEPRQGDIIAAFIDGQSTLKTLAKQNGEFFLKAENVKYIDMIPMNELLIHGVVRAVIRRMN